MKKMFVKLLFLSVAISNILLITSDFVWAQKIPSKQSSSLRIGTNFHIDGLPIEWNDQYQAYNKNIEAFYTIANDDDNLYLIVHAEKSRTIEKIIEGGLSFTISKSAKNDVKDKVVILFPLMPLPICKGVLVAAGKSLTGKTMNNNREEITSSLNAEAKLNASIAKANALLIDNLKEIKVSGIATVVDTVANVNENTPYYRTLPLRSHSFKIIPKGNQDSIKAMIQFDTKSELTYELLMPLKYIDYLKTKPNTLYYNITINGRGKDGRPGNTIAFSPPPNQGIIDQDLEEPTDFWGEYTLAKKP